MRTLQKAGWGVVLLLLICSTSPGKSIAADEAPNPTESQEKQEELSPVELEMEDVEIRGELERPEVFYIIPRRKARMDLGSMSKDYHDKILEPVSPERFEAKYGN